jgi:hypothetical protein
MDREQCIPHQQQPPLPMLQLQKGISAALPENEHQKSCPDGAELFRTDLPLQEP